MHWRRRTIARIMLLLTGSSLMFVESLDSGYGIYAKLPRQGSGSHSAASSSEATPCLQLQLYHQQPWIPNPRHSGYRQQPDFLGLDLSLLHQEPEWGAKSWIPAGMDEETPQREFQLPSEAPAQLPKLPDDSAAHLPGNPDLSTPDW